MLVTFLNARAATPLTRSFFTALAAVPKAADFPELVELKQKIREMAAVRYQSLREDMIIEIKMRMWRLAENYHFHRLREYLQHFV